MDSFGPRHPLLRRWAVEEILATAELDGSLGVTFLSVMTHNLLVPQLQKAMRHRIEMWGSADNPSSATPESFIVRLQLPSPASPFDLTLPAPVSVAQTNKVWHAIIDMTVQTAGISGVLRINGKLESEIGTTYAAAVKLGARLYTGDLSSAITLNARVALSAAVAGYKIRVMQGAWELMEPPP